MDIKKIEEKRQLMLNELPKLQEQLNQIQIRIRELSGGIKLCNELIGEEKAKEEKELKDKQKKEKEDGS